MKKYILILTLAAFQFGQAAPVAEFRPATAALAAGETLTVRSVLAPAGEMVCVAEGRVQVSGASCQSITLAEGVISQKMPTCADPEFLIGIPGCAKEDQELFAVVLKGVQPGTAKIEYVAMELIGEGKALGQESARGVYEITAGAVPAGDTALLSNPLEPGAIASGVATRAAEKVTDLAAAVTSGGLSANWFVPALVLVLIIFGWFYLRRGKKDEA